MISTVVVNVGNVSFNWKHLKIKYHRRFTNMQCFQNDFKSLMCVRCV